VAETVFASMRRVVAQHRRGVRQAADGAVADPAHHALVAVDAVHRAIRHLERTKRDALAD
jgi:hypothetical protein